MEYDLKHPELHLLLDAKDQPTSTSMRFMTEITSGLEFLHKLEIVHNDMRPYNILLKWNEQIKGYSVRIADMGLSKKIDDKYYSLSTKVSGIWFSKEIIMDENTKTKAVDIFTIGLLFFHMMTKGNHPFSGM